MSKPDKTDALRTEQKHSDLMLLKPVFRKKVRGVLDAMRGQGFKPLVWETYRSLERSRMLQARGVSKARGGYSMHCYGIAVDIICMDHMWQCRKHHCKFFETLGKNYEDQGITWGGNWDRDQRAGEDGENDLPHGQLVPATPKAQDAIRAMTPEELDAFVANYGSK